ncbi:MAG: hypothetical protein V3U37_06280, partial [Nitrospinaceae bacterium]
MKETNILFLAPNWRVSLIKAFQTAKAELNIEGRLVGADSDPNSPALRALDSVHTIPLFSESGCLEQVTEIIRTQSIHAVLPLTNKAVEFLAANRERFEGENVFLYIQENKVIETCHDKLKLAEYCDANNIAAPRTLSLDSPGDSPRFPLIAKPRRGEGSKNCFRINDRADL